MLKNSQSLTKSKQQLLIANIITKKTESISYAVNSDCKGAGECLNKCKVVFR